MDHLQARLAELERFATTAAHELQAPLITLQGFLAGLETAAKSGDWDRFHADISRIQRITQELREATDALLRLANEKFTPQAVSLSQAATEAAELLHDALAQRQMTVTIHPDLPTISGDPVLWRHVLQNLIANAVKACADVPCPVIEIGCRRSGDQEICYVRDNGVGLDPASAAQLFQSPAGIGLHLVRSVIERHGGNVWAESAGKGQGTTVLWTVNIIRHSA